MEDEGIAPNGCVSTLYLFLVYRHVFLSIATVCIWKSFHFACSSIYNSFIYDLQYGCKYVPVISCGDSTSVGWHNITVFLKGGGASARQKLCQIAKNKPSPL